MRRSTAVLLALMLAWVAAPLCAQGVRYQVEIEAPQELAQTLRKGLNLMRWQEDREMTRERLERLVAEALREAREVAATEGFFSPQVDARIDEAQTPWTVRLSLSPGERTRVSEVDIGFRGPAVEDPAARALIERVRESWSLRPGQAFRQEEWDDAKRRAVQALSAWRYAAASIAESEALVDPRTALASLAVVIDSGPPFRFGKVRVLGNRRYADAVIENFSPMRPGDTYDRDKLLLYQRRLLETGYFASVQAEIDTQGEDAGAAAPVRIAVVEAPSQHVEAGVGYSTDAGARLELRYSNQDVFEEAWRFRSELRLDERIRSLQLDLDAPPRPGARWNSVFARARETDIQNEITRELAAGVAHNFGRELAPSALIVSGHLEEQRLAGGAFDNRQAVYFGYRRTFRRTDDFVSPRAGYLGTIEVGGAPPELSTQEFLRALASASLFVPLGSSNDLLLRGQAGGIVAGSRLGIPTSFLFRTGGDQTVRGYAFESLGLRQGEAVVGGRRLLVASAELTHWLSDTWGIAGFVDAGDAWDKGTAFSAAVGLGIGVRFRTPIGPIRADLAYGEQTSAFRLHFSVGYRF